MLHPVTITIPSHLKMLPLVRSFLETVCQIEEVDKSTIFAVVTAVSEAFSNVVRHAHQYRDDAVVKIACRIDRDSVAIEVTDQGRAFDIDEVPHLDPTEVRFGGRGVYLIRSLMDEVATEPIPRGGNRLRMVKRRGSSGQNRDCG